MKELCLLGILTAVLGLTPVSHQLQSTGAHRQLLEKRAVASLAVGIEAIDPPGSENDQPLKGARDNLEKPHHLIRSQSPKRHKPKPSTIDSQTRDSIKSFQTETELQTARLNPEVADELGFQVADSEVDP